MSPIELLGISFFIAVGIVVFVSLAAIASSIDKRTQNHIKRRRKS